MAKCLKDEVLEIVEKSLLKQKEEEIIDLKEDVNNLSEEVKRFSKEVSSYSNACVFFFLIFWFLLCAKIFFYFLS